MSHLICTCCSCLAEEQLVERERLLYAQWEDLDMPCSLSKYRHHHLSYK